MMLTCISMDVIVLILLSCSMAANSSNEDTLSALGWGYIHQTGDSSGSTNAKWFIGLAGYSFDAMLSQDDDYDSSYSTFSDCDVDFNSCSGCYTAGQAAFALLIISMTFTFVSLVLSFLRIARDGRILRYSCIVLGCLSIVFVGGVAVGFYNSCLVPFARDANVAAEAYGDSPHTSQQMGSGATLAVVGVFVSVVVVALHVFTCSPSDISTSSRSGTNNLRTPLVPT